MLLWVIWVGANDACLPDYPYHVPVDEYGRNIKAMVTAIRASAHSRESTILIVTPPPIDHEMLTAFHRRKGLDRSVELTKGYAAKAREVGLEIGKGDKGVEVLDFYRVLLEGEGGDLRSFMTDGLHLGPKVCGGWECRDGG